MSKQILITGCSSGIGHEAVKALVSRGHHVIASCRKASDVQRWIDQGYKAIQLDVNDSASIKQAWTQVMAMTDGRLDALINNAGYGQAGALEDVPRDILREQFETNVFGLMELSALAIPVMRKQGSGRIINISSVLGFISMPFRGAYNASKYAVEGLCDTLRLELKSSGIDVICIEPGPIESEFRNQVVDISMKKIDITRSYFYPQYQSMLGDYKNKKSNSSWTCKPDLIAKKLIHAIESKHPKPKYLATVPTYLFMILKRILPVRWLDGCLRFVSKRELQG